MALSDSEITLLTYIVSAVIIPFVGYFTHKRIKQRRKKNVT